MKGNFHIKRLICTAILFSLFLQVPVMPMQNIRSKNNSNDISGDISDVENNRNLDLGTPVVVFAHGFGEAGLETSRYYSYRNMFPNCETKSFEFPDSPRLNKNDLDRSKTTFGQGPEKILLEENCQHYKDGGRKVLAMGVSRGAICVMTANLPGIEGRFAESPAAHFKDIVDLKCKQFGFGWVPGLGWVIHKFFVKPIVFRSYDPNGLQPIDQARNISNETPVLIVCTSNDKLIPASSSARLAEELFRQGHRNVYLYVTNDGSHANILGRDQNYVNLSHAFLKRCGLLDKNFDCENGEQLLENAKINNLQQVVNTRGNLQAQEWRRYRSLNIGVFLTCAATTAVSVFAVKKLLNYFQNKRKAKLNFKKKHIFGKIFG